MYADERQVCRGADIVYLLSALDLPVVPDEASLRVFSTGTFFSFAKHTVVLIVLIVVYSCSFQPVADSNSSNENGHTTVLARLDRAEMLFKNLASLARSLALGVSTADGPPFHPSRTKEHCKRDKTS